jgi:hypothetical protein
MASIGEQLLVQATKIGLSLIPEITQGLRGKEVPF